MYNRNTGNKPIKASNELSFINAQLKKINERIRAYAKVMTMVFKEDYNLKINPVLLTGSVTAANKKKIYASIENGEVVDRMKYVRYSFLQTVEVSETHWLDRPIIPNKIDKNISELFESENE